MSESSMKSTRIDPETTAAMVLTQDTAASVAMETVPLTDPTLMAEGGGGGGGGGYGGYNNSPAPPTPGGVMSPTTPAAPGGMNPAAYTPEYIAQVQAYYNQTGSDPYAAYGGFAAYIAMYSQWAASQAAPQPGPPGSAPPPPPSENPPPPPSGPPGSGYNNVPPPPGM